MSYSSADSGHPAFPSSVQQIFDYHELKTFPQFGCRQISALFSRTQPTDVERNFPLAYVVQLYEDAELFVKQLQFICMPQNSYCIDIDKSSSTVLVNAVEQTVRCCRTCLSPRKGSKLFTFTIPLFKLSWIAASKICLRVPFPGVVQFVWPSFSFVL